MSRWTIALLIAFAVVAYVEIRARRGEIGRAASFDPALFSATVVQRFEGDDPASARTWVVTRARELVHRKDGPSREWLFRNDGQGSQPHFSGTLVDHEKKAVVDFDGADLIQSGIAESFESVACPGVSSAGRT